MVNKYIRKISKSSTKWYYYFRCKFIYNYLYFLEFCFLNDKKNLCDQMQLFILFWNTANILSTTLQTKQKDKWKQSSK